LSDILTACFEFYPAARHLTKHSATWPERMYYTPFVL
jgi:hypothetical protein